ncbi:hypothetical protein MP638_006444 [Amoeboaphelidium occidentale]|nr:hypothetical protein MP638_006444 [Amoeboaphelidium occidentale]
MGLSLFFGGHRGLMKRDVYYLLNKKVEVNAQEIYKFFERPSELFVNCYNADFSEILPATRSLLLDCSLFVFGFIDLLLFGDANKKSAAVYVRKMKGSDLKKNIEEKWKTADEKPIVVLDEFLPFIPGELDFSAGEKKLNFIRNGFLSVGIVTIIMGTDAKVANLLEKSSFSREGKEYEWCYIFTDLPPVIDSFKEAVNNFWHYVLCHSRPLFEETAFTLSSKTRRSASADVDRLLAELFEQFMNYKNIYNNPFGQLGQIALTLHVAHLGSSPNDSTFGQRT